MAVGQQSSATDRIPIAVERERMQRLRVGVVPFEHFGNALFDHEYGAPDISQCIAVTAPIRASHGESHVVAHE